MWYIVTFITGFFVGFLVFSIITANSNIERIEKAYIEGIKEGKRRASE